MQDRGGRNLAFADAAALLVHCATPAGLVDLADTGTLYRYVTDKTALAMGWSERFLDALPSYDIVPNRHFGTTVPSKLYLMSDVELSVEAEDAIEMMADFARK